MLRLFHDTLAGRYRRRQGARGIAGGQCGAVTVMQRRPDGTLAGSFAVPEPPRNCAFGDAIGFNLARKALLPPLGARLLDW